MGQQFLTSSWDDGDPLDLRLAERLASVGWAATFYLCRDFDGRPRLSDREVVELADFPGVEVGAYAYSS
jgi:peptidoglycan-N-acetylglucosamine deacetylase